MGRLVARSPQILGSVLSNRTFQTFNKTKHHLDRRRLPRAVWTDVADDLARFNIERDVCDCVDDAHSWIALSIRVVESYHRTSSMTCTIGYASRCAAGKMKIQRVLKEFEF